MSLHQARCDLIGECCSSDFREDLSETDSDESTKIATLSGFVANFRLSLLRRVGVRISLNSFVCPGTDQPSPDLLSALVGRCFGVCRSPAQADRIESNRQEPTGGSRNRETKPVEPSPVRSTLTNPRCPSERGEVTEISIDKIKDG